MSEEEVIQFISACWNKFGEHTATLVSAEKADIEIFLSLLKYDLDELRGNNKTLQATIADKDTQIAELKLWVKDRNKIMLEQAKELSILKEVAAVIISEDPEDHKPVCCGGSIQSMCGCMGATPISMAYHELRQILKSTTNPIGDAK